MDTNIIKGQLRDVDKDEDFMKYWNKFYPDITFDLDNEVHMYIAHAYMIGSIEAYNFSIKHLVL